MKLRASPDCSGTFLMISDENEAVFYKKDKFLTFSDDGSGEVMKCYFEEKLQ